MSGSPLPCVLITGFDGFGEDRDSGKNPSSLAALQLQGQIIAGHRVESASLPTAFGASGMRLKELVLEHRPSLVLCVGQAGGRAAIELERVAINVDDAPVPDNAGQQPIDQAVIAGGPAAYFSRLPIKACVLALTNAAVPARISQSAGTFVCNHVFYTLMHELAGMGHRARGGFVHVPWLPEQGQPSLPADIVVKALRIIVQTSLNTDSDSKQAGGQIA